MELWAALLWLRSAQPHVEVRGGGDTKVRGGTAFAHRGGGDDECLRGGARSVDVTPRPRRPRPHQAAQCTALRMGNAVTNQIVGSVVDDKIEALTGSDEKEDKPKKSTDEKMKEAEEEKRANDARQAAAAERAAANREKSNAIRAKYGLQQK